MRRLILGLIILGLVIPTFLAAQDVPATTPDPFAPPDETGDLPELLPIPTEAPVVNPASPFESEALQLLIDARNDLEILANQNMGIDRPVGWSGSQDGMNPQLPILIRLDLELLAGTLMGVDQRPTGWFGAVPSTAYAIARDIRHDIELLADQVNPAGIRPPGWIGGDPVIRCERGVQTLVFVLERTAGFTLTVDPFSRDYCSLAELQATAYAENKILPNKQAASISSPQGTSATNTGVRVSSEFAVAFLDRHARQPTGTIPLGEPLTPVARSYTQFSRMMLVRGNGFEVFIDYGASSIDENSFAALPDVNNVSYTAGCAASWCAGVG
ncbi:MAG: hypothetical protein R3E39_06750 [Anaerolineae bacterium]